MKRLGKNYFHEFFSVSEKEDFLMMRGFIVEDYGVIKEVVGTNSNIEDISVTIRIAYKNNVDKKIRGSVYLSEVLNKVGVDVVFDEEIKIKMLFQ